MQIEIFDLGLVNFKSAWQVQKEIFKAVKCQNLKHALILAQHNPVITLGRAASRENILTDNRELSLKGIQIYEIERGGDVTYHGPGQVTVYPIFNLNHIKKDIHFFLRRLEDVIIEFLGDFGVMGLKRPGLTGVWIGKEKIASIGIAIRNWITFHGLSINIKKNDLDNFGLIRPCGMDIKMTSLETVLGRNVELGSVKQGLIDKFRRG